MRGISNGVVVQAKQEVEAGTLREEIALLLRTFEHDVAPDGHVKETAHVEKSRLKNAEVFRKIGNAFLSLGLTLPAGKRDDPLRNDSVAFKLGNTLMQSDHAGTRGEAPLIEDNMRQEVCTALGRAILHIRNAAGIQANSVLRPQSDTYERDRAFKSSVGKLTLQLLEGAGTLRNSVPQDPKRKEVFLEALGAVMIKLEGVATRTQQTERDREDKSLLNRLPAAVGPQAKQKLPELKPHVRPDRPEVKRVGSTLQKESSTRESPLIRTLNTGNHLVKRPLLPSGQMANL
jgi:hypothetical protein